MSEMLGESPPDEAVVLVTAVRRWEDELRALESRRVNICQKLDAARKLLDLIIVDGNAVLLIEAKAYTPLPEAQPPLPEPSLAAVSLAPDAKWIDAVRAWIHSAPRGLSYQQMRAMMDATPGFSERYQQSEKGYYGAIARLASNREIIKHNGHLFSPEAFELFKDDVDAGRVADEPPASVGYSPMGEAILDIVGGHREKGISGKEIIQELRRDPEFNATLSPHQTGAYNIIARLVKRRQILRRDDGLCFPGIKFPPRDPASKWLVRRAVNGSGLHMGAAL